MKYSRQKIVDKVINEIVKYEDIELLNEVNDELILLSKAIEDNLYANLIEQDCSNSSAKVFDWLVQDYLNCVNQEDLVRLTEQQYNKLGELKYNNIYSFDVEY